jgi:hypothetical protein
MNESEIDLDNLPLAEALSFADEGSTTGGLLTHAALKTLAAGCRELTAARAEIEAIHATGGCSFKELHRVIEQRDRLAELLSEYMTKVPLGNQPHMLALKADEALQSLTTKEL